MLLEERIKYYMGYFYDRKIIIYKDKIIREKINPLFNYTICMHYNDLYDFIEKNKNTILYNYYTPLKEILDHLSISQHNPCFLCIPGDISTILKNKGVIVKSRSKHDIFSILFKLNIDRHWKSIYEVKKNDIDYVYKKNKIIWRGSTTGIYTYKSSRKILVENYFKYDENIIDVGFNEILDDTYLKYKKNTLSLKELLQHKFILSIEGNDVASGLKWQLYSNSVVFMCKPKVCSWLMEDRLEPYIHYIPLKDNYSDIIEQYYWALQNTQICLEITKNANKYIEQFLDIENEKKIMSEILLRYFDNIKII